jgi:hypothetical protein
VALRTLDQATRREIPSPLQSRWPQAPARARASRLRAIHQALAKASWSGNRLNAERATWQKRAPFGKGACTRPSPRAGSVRRASPRLGIQANTARPTLRSVGGIRHCDLRLGEPRPPRPQQSLPFKPAPRLASGAGSGCPISRTFGFRLSSVPHRHSRVSDQRGTDLLERGRHAWLAGA